MLSTRLLPGVLLAAVLSLLAPARCHAYVWGGPPAEWNDYCSMVPITVNTNVPEPRVVTQRLALNLGAAALAQRIEALKSDGQALAATILESQAQSAAPTCQINVTYHGFTPEAKKAVAHAMSIWEHLLVSSVPINVDCTWASDPAWESNILGCCSATGYWCLPTSPLAAYPTALAERMIGSNLALETTPGSDINIKFNADRTDWYLGIDGPTPPYSCDLVSVAVHELAHGLGLASSFYPDYNVGRHRVSPTYGCLLPPLAMYDLFLEDYYGYTAWGTSYPEGTSKLFSLMLGDNLYWRGDSGRAANGGVRPKLYAPMSWQGGSSVSHLDEETYPAGDPNSAMTPALSHGERVHSPGPITLGILQDLGWMDTYGGCQPDLQMRKAEDSSFVGKGVYENDPITQQITRTLRPVQIARFVVRLTNRGNLPSTYGLYLWNPDSHVKWTVYNTGGGNVVSQAVAEDGWETPLLAPGETLEVPLEAQLAQGTLLGSAGDRALLWAYSKVRKGDADTGAILLQPPFTRPDLMLRLSSSASESYLGSGTFNGDPQTLTTSTGVGQPVVYRIRLTNSSAEDDLVRLTGTAPPGANLKLSWFHDSSDQTSMVFGGQGALFSLEPWESTEFLLKVTPGATAPTPLPVRLHAQSEWRAGALDEVTAELGRQPLETVKLLPYPAGPQTPGTTISLTAVPQGGTQVMYAISIARKGQIITGGEPPLLYTASPDFTWKPTVEGVYTLKVLAREAGAASGVQDSLAYTVEKAPLSAASLECSPASSAVVGQPVSLTAGSTGGAGVTYQFSALHQGDLIPLTAYASSRQYTWIPSQPGDYVLRVTARDGPSDGEAETVVAARPFTVSVPLSGVTLLASPGTPEIGAVVWATAAASGGAAAVEYRFWLTPERGGRRLLRDWDASQTASCGALEKGSTLIEVEARGMGAGGQQITVTKGLAVTPVEAVSQVTLSAIPASPLVLAELLPGLKAQVTLTAKSRQSGSLLYRFEELVDGQTQVLRDWSTSASCTWNPSEVGDHSLRVLVKRNLIAFRGQVTAVETLSYRVLGRGAGLSLSSEPAGAAQAGSPVLLKARISGFTRPEVRYVLISGGEAKELRGYHSQPDYEWTPSTAGTYALEAWVRESQSEDPYDLRRSLTLTVTPAATPTPVTIQTVVLGLKVVAGLVTPTAEQTAALDVDQNGRVTIQDVVRLLKTVAGLP